ncbi:MAG TPA: hypothetical protein VFG54_12130 [Prolixibacteraceae bacterium]|nr:hypothetical protein [Prolixibacteraceae bacterium]
MGQITIKRKRIAGILNALGQIKGMKEAMKSISLGRDIRALRQLMDEAEEALDRCKPENYETLAKELRELKQKKAREIEPSLKEGEVVNEQIVTSHVFLTWPKVNKWMEMTREYEAAEREIMNTEVEVVLHTEFVEKDLPKAVEDAAVAEALSYFMKEQ